MSLIYMALQEAAGPVYRCLTRKWGSHTTTRLRRQA